MSEASTVHETFAVSATRSPLTIAVEHQEFKNNKKASGSFNGGCPPAFLTGTFSARSGGETVEAVLATV